MKRSFQGSVDLGSSVLEKGFQAYNLSNLVLRWCSSVGLEMSIRSEIFVTLTTVWTVHAHVMKNCLVSIRVWGNCSPTPPLTQHFAHTAEWERQFSYSAN